MRATLIPAWLRGWGILRLGLILVLSGCSVSIGTGTGTGTPAPSGSVMKAGPASLYPNPALTPGDIFPGVTKEQVCVSGYSMSVRSVTSDERAEVFRRYNTPEVAGKYEVDHFISLELGGSNALTNLWPEPYEPVPGAHEKDKVENYLHAQVCNGSMTLAAAQQAITSDWYAVYIAHRQAVATTFSKQASAPGMLYTTILAQHSYALQGFVAVLRDERPQATASEAEVSAYQQEQLNAAL